MTNREIASILMVVAREMQKRSDNRNSLIATVALAYENK
jgi:hypothetical protein